MVEREKLTNDGYNYLFCRGKIENIHNQEKINLTWEKDEETKKLS